MLSINDEKGGGNWFVGGKNCLICSRKILFTLWKSEFYDMDSVKCCIFATVKTNRRCETSFHHLLLIQIKLESLI